jgi:hypothetical protein
MDSGSPLTPSRGRLSAFLLFAVFLGLVVSRRWAQVVTPQVWCEDGRIISGFISNGWPDFLQPLNGYLVTVPKIITRISLAVSVYYYPMVSTVLACLFSSFIGLAVAFSPTRLKGRVFCAFALFLVPSDTEVFGLPLYTLWWAPILLLLLALWDERRPCLALRLGFVAAGGLSSPFILVVMPVLILRAFWYRRLFAEKAVAVAAAIVCAVQANFILRGAHVALPTISSLATYVVPRFCGWFLFGNFTEANAVLWPAGFLVIAVIASFWIEGRRSCTAWILVFLYCGALASSVLRVDPAAAHPVRGGPRYFFFPFVLTFWIFIELYQAAKGRGLRAVLGGAIGVAILNAVPVWSRGHDDLRWADHLASARLFPDYDIPIESDGHRSHAWSIQEPGSIWAHLLRHDGILSSEKLAAHPTFAYRVVPDADSGWDSTAGNGAVIVSAEKELVLKLSAGKRIRYRSGPVTRPQSMQVVGFESAFLADLPVTADWVTLEFSNSTLPREFTLKIVDHGQGIGEWARSSDR